MSRVVIFFLLSLSFSLFAQDYDICGFEDENTIESEQYVTGTGGTYFTARGHVHCLALFVEFPDDQYDINSDFWHKGQAPRVLNTFFDDTLEYPSGRHNISNYFYEMSNTNGASNRLDLTGEGIYILLNN